MTSDGQTLHSLIYDYSKDGEKLDAGCSFDEIEHFIAICKSINANKSVCAVKHWQWWDLDISEKGQKYLSNLGQYPSLIKADHVIDDQVGRFNTGDWVRTSLLIKFHANCIFETGNTFYLLVGAGTRKTVDPDLPVALF